MYMLANFNPLSCTSALKALVGITTEYRANFLCTFVGANQLLTSEIKKVLQRNCKTQLMERDALNQQHVTQCNAIAPIKYRRSLLVVGKSTG